jgi:hypothetical protein
METGSRKVSIRVGRVADHDIELGMPEFLSRSKTCDEGCIFKLEGYVFIYIGGVVKTAASCGAEPVTTR